MTEQTIQYLGGGAIAILVVKELVPLIRWTVQRKNGQASPVQCETAKVLGQDLHSRDTVARFEQEGLKNSIEKLSANMEKNTEAVHALTLKVSIMSRDLNHLAQRSEP